MSFRMQASGFTGALTRCAATLFGLSCSMPSAYATETLICSVNDPALQLDLIGHVTAGGRYLSDVSGSIVLTRPNTPPRRYKLSESELLNQTIAAKKLRIAFRIPGESGSLVSLEIKGYLAPSAAAGPNNYNGSYALKVTGPGGDRRLRGRIGGCNIGE